MRVEDLTYDDIDFFDCCLHEIEVSGSSIAVTVDNAKVERGNGLAVLPSLRFSFCGVTSSTRTIAEYASAPLEEGTFLRPYVVEDSMLTEAGPRSGVPHKQFLLEGVLRSPRAWLDWTLVAEKLSIREAEAA